MIAAGFALVGAGIGAGSWVSNHSIHIAGGNPQTQSAPVLEAEVKLGNAALDSKNNAEAIERYRKAAELGSAAALPSGLGVLYHFDLGVKRDYAAAMQWYSKEATREATKPS